MENISVLTDFETLSSSASFTELPKPEGLEAYNVYLGGNFIFISNEKNRAVRFSLPDFQTSDISEDTVKTWLTKIKSIYPNF